MSRESKILTIVLVLVVGAMIGLFAYFNRDTSGPAPVGDKTKITRDTSHKQDTGAVQIVEFGDFQCPACGKTHPIVKQLTQDYAGKITFYFRNFPLTQLHPNAEAAARAAEAAALQDKYWPMHDKLYDTQKDWSDLNTSDVQAKFVGYAKDLGLDIDKFKTDYASDPVNHTVAQDLADANALNLQATPTFFINGNQYTGNNDYPSLRDAIEAQLKKK